MVFKIKASFRTPTVRWVLGGLPVIVFALGPIAAVRAEGRQELPLSGEELFDSACATCHGTDGTGADPAAVGFDIPLPDFSDCNFASREPNGDWLGVVHDGGPTRAFDRIMPAFGDALTEDEMLRTLGHVRSFCGEDRWPRGELNLPRALVTEKAFPEDESVVTVTIDAEDPGAVMTKFVHEKRFGARTQMEFAVPFSFAERDSGSWRGGVGDMSVALKHTAFHSLDTGSIVSAHAEVVFPTGDEDRGFGKGFTVFEPFVTYGQLFPRDSFLQFQGGFEIPADRDHADEAFWRTTLGKTLTQGRFGRSWTPMVEFLAVRELADGENTKWDIVPQIQVSLPTRQHILFNVGVRTPLNDRSAGSTQIMVYLLWDWFDGGLFEGW